MNEEVKALERIKDITMRGDMSLGGRIACIQSIAHDTLRTRTPASCSPDVEALVEFLRTWPATADHRDALNVGVVAQKMEQAADALESMMREKDAMREALKETLQALLNTDYYPAEVAAKARAALNPTKAD